MQTLCSSLLILYAAIINFSQLKDPVKWDFTAKKLREGIYELHMTATIEKKWHIYSQSTPSDGPVATAFSFNKNPIATFDGTVKEVGKLETHFEKLFDTEVRQYSNKVDFIQKVKVKGKVKTTISGSVEYMACNDKECLPPATTKFSIKLQ